MEMQNFDTSSEEDFRAGTIIANTWEITGSIFKGVKSEVFKGKDIRTGELVAIKTENPKRDHLTNEFLVYKGVNNTSFSPYCAKMLYYKFIPAPVLVLKYAGVDLHELQKACQGFSNNQIFTYATLLIRAIENLHNCGFVHRDIKPKNFVTFTNDSVKLIDFGIVSRWRDSIGNHVKLHKNCRFRGTFTYASVNAHNLLTPSRRDDLESLGYMLISFMRHCLPWSDIECDLKNKRVKVGTMKADISIEELTLDLPAPLREYMSYVKRLKFEDTPEYDYLRDLFKL